MGVLSPWTRQNAAYVVLCRVGNAKLIQGVYDEFCSLIFGTQDQHEEDNDWTRFRNMFQQHTVGHFKGDQFEQSHESLVISALSGFIDLNGRDYFSEYAPTRKRKCSVLVKDQSDTGGQAYAAAGADAQA